MSGLLLPEFAVATPRSLEEALTARRADSSSRFIAGGTDLVPNLRLGLGAPQTLIDLRGIPELRRIAFSSAGLVIGAAVTLAELVENDTLGIAYPALVAAAAAVSAPALREAGTLGGNLALDTRCLFYNKSQWWREANDFCLKYEGTRCHVAPGGSRCYAAYSGDLAAALLAYDAEVEVAGANGVRRLPLTELFEDDGMAHMRLLADELIVAVHLPPHPWPAGYAKSRQRGAIDFPLAGVAVALLTEDGIVRGLRVGLTGVGSRPILLEDADSFVGARFDDAALERLGKSVQKAVSPMRTTTITPHYRRRVIGALATRLVKELLNPR
ncbi:MAG: 4-hydroxybenzoyl-CoA reductase subunit beta [Candidatus Velthaea sp.]|jgi:4-hydroxybenzoyl-CoA reductase subunit beta